MELTRLLRARTVAGCLIVLPALLRLCVWTDAGSATADGTDRPADRVAPRLCCRAGAQGSRGISALLPFPNSGVPSVDPAILSDRNVDGISVRLYWRDFYTRQNDPGSPIDWAALDALVTGFIRCPDQRAQWRATVHQPGSASSMVGLCP
jgi:hypothetical protein